MTSAVAVAPSLTAILGNITLRCRTMFHTTWHFESGFAAADDGPDIGDDVMVSKPRRIGMRASSCHKDLSALGVEVSNGPQGLGLDAYNLTTVKLKFRDRAVVFFDEQYRTAFEAQVDFFLFTVAVEEVEAFALYQWKYGEAEVR